MGQVLQTPSRVFLFSPFKNGKCTWHMWIFRPFKATRSAVTCAAWLIFAQICARSTDILHGNYPLLAATSRFNAPQALQLYTKIAKIAIVSNDFLHMIKNKLLQTLHAFYSNIAQKQAFYPHFAPVLPLLFRIFTPSPPP